jgi:hypothetical protein
MSWSSGSEHSGVKSRGVKQARAKAFLCRFNDPIFSENASAVLDELDDGQDIDRARHILGSRSSELPA